MPFSLNHYYYHLDPAGQSSACTPNQPIKNTPRAKLRISSLTIPDAQCNLSSTLTSPGQLRGSASRCLLRAGYQSTSISPPITNPSPSHGSGHPSGSIYHLWGDIQCY